MEFQWHHDAMRTRQHRSSTEPVPPQPPFPPIPPSLIPGNRHRQTFSATPTANGLLYSGHGAVTYPMAKVPAFPPVGSYAVNFSPYRDFQPPPPPPPPLPQAQSPVLPPPPPPRQQQPVVPPLPPKTPIPTSPSISPTVPPRPPPFVPPPPPTHTRPKLSARSQSQPPPPRPRGSSSSLPAPPPIPPPPKPMGARSASYKVTSTSSLLLQPHATPSAKPSPPAKGHPDTDATPQLTTPPVTAPAKGQLEMNEEQELELALELSAHTVREHVNSLVSQDEELARALEESLHDSPPQPVQSRSQPNRLVIESENVPSSSSMKPGDTYSHGSKPSSHAPSPLLAPSPVDAQLREDEAFARRLEAQYEDEPSSPTTAKAHSAGPSAGPSASAFPSLPRYADVVGRETVVERFESDAVASPRVQQVSPTSAPTDDRLSVSDQANTPPQNSPSPAQRPSPRPEALETTGSPSEEEGEVLESASSSPQSSRPLATPNEFVEPELLYGVSFGFNTPPMDNLEMRGSVPNIIALPFGKSPPMYIRAPSWRQLLKLMAKLSATRVEPSVEALAVTKGELQLRTVIQFFKLHQNSSDWRTVIYLTIDYPPPPDYRYTNMDVNVLPYSYGLSTVPALLRNGPDSHISKYYTVPVTARTPLPKLPISLPNLAMYLTAALEESRRALGDSSSGLRRLAKMIDQFYPNQASQREAGDEEGRRRGGFIGRLMGRSSRPQGGRNADVYDLVTPFVPDEWG